MIGLFGTRRFLPLFITQFLGALNDNLLKTALLVLATYRAGAEGGSHIYTLFAAGLFILPFFLFSATAGLIADRIDRQRITRVVKLAEIGIMLIVAFGLSIDSKALLLSALFLMGTHSTFFGPVKYSLLPQHLREDELLAGNGYVEAGTFLAILLGTLFGGAVVLSDHGTSRLSWLLGLVAVAGYAASRFIPPAPAPRPELPISLNPLRETIAILRHAKANRRVFRAIVGISWFWLLGSAFLTQFPAFAKETLSGEASVFSLLLAVFSLGIGAGAFLCNRLLRGQVQATYVPGALLGMSLFIIDLYTASHALTPAPALLGIGGFLGRAGSLRVVFDLFMLALCGGVYTVPLYALMQTESDAENRARTIAANNVMNALFMVAAALALMALSTLGMTIPQSFLALGVLSLGVAIYVCTLLPDALLRSMVRLLLRLAYRVEISGLAHYREAGEKVLLIANHTSLLDAALIAAFLPEKITFAVNTHVAKLWWMRPLLLLVDAFPLDPTNPMATKTLIDAVKAGRKVMIFPEGRITVTGTLMKVYEGPGLIADKSGAALLPIRIDGAQYTPFSYLRGKLRLRWFPRIRVTILPPERFVLPEEAKGRRRRQLASAMLYDRMAAMLFETSPYRRTLFAALLDAAVVHGRGHKIVEDITRHPQSYRRFLAGSLTLGRAVRKHSREEWIGLLLPTSLPMALSLFGLLGHGRVAALLNFSAGSAAIVSACRTAQLRVVVTSTRFVKLAKLEEVVAALEAEGIRVLRLELLGIGRGFASRLYLLTALFFPALLHRLATKRQSPDAPAVILFTSGSEGTPKGVVLSHANLLANLYQLAASVDFSENDTVFNCLPMFHAFGLTGGTLLPLLGGMRAFLYSSPLHYRIVPELIYDTNATILFGTDTFLAGYAKMAHPYDLHDLRYIFAGAERVKDETRRVFMERFGVRVYEGYGATETAPVIAVNTPMRYRAGSVGPLLPGIEGALEPVPGITEGGQLRIRGPNVMLGYFKADGPGALQSPPEGWYDTGDIVTIDEDGYLRIVGRSKRFAKIAGEMVSLPVIETAAESIWPEAQHVAVAVPDTKKGEQVVLLTNGKEVTREALQRYFKEYHLPELALPRVILPVETMPLLGTGKTDYVAARELAMAVPVTIDVDESD